MIDRAHAAFAPGLAANYDILLVLLKLNPRAEFKPTVLVKAWLTCCKHYTGLNASGLPDDMWAGRRADICGTMLCHTRRVRSDTLRMSQLKHKATASDMAMVQELVDMIVEGAISREPSPAETVLYTTRKLKVNVSLDEDGFPKMLSTSSSASKSSSSKSEDIKALSGDSEFAFLAELQAMSLASNAGRARLAASTVPEDEEPESGEANEGADAPDVEAAAPAKRKLAKPLLETPLPKRRQSTESVAKSANNGNQHGQDEQPNGGQCYRRRGVDSVDTCVNIGNQQDQDQQPKGGDCKMGHVKLTLASKQSYITAGKKLVVAVSEKQSEDHALIARMIFDQMLKGKIANKEDALSLRARLVE